MDLSTVYDYVLKSLIPAIIFGLLGYHSKNLIKKHPKLLSTIGICVFLFVLILIPISLIYNYYSNPVLMINTPENFYINNAKVVIKENNSFWKIDKDTLYSFAIPLGKSENIPKVLVVKFEFDKQNTVSSYLDKKIMGTTDSSNIAEININNTQINNLKIINEFDSDYIPLKFKCEKDDLLNSLKIQRDFRKDFNIIFIISYSFPIILAYILVCLMLFKYYKKKNMDPNK